VSTRHCLYLAGNAATVETTVEVIASTAAIIQSKIKSTKEGGVKTKNKKKDSEMEQNLAFRYKQTYTDSCNSVSIT
jgi:hypothetical protein